MKLDTRGDIAWKLFQQMYTQKIPLDDITKRILQRVFDKPHHVQNLWKEVKVCTQTPSATFLPVALFVIKRRELKVTHGCGWVEDQDNLELGLGLADKHVDVQFARKSLALSSRVQNQASINQVNVNQCPFPHHRYPP
jgi:hypothetical protein